MSTTLTWLGHASFALQSGGIDVLIDPFLDDSPTAPVKSGDVKADVILVTHGHFDHVADVSSIASRTGATVVANYEIGEWFKNQGVGADKVIGMNLGGGLDLPCGRASMTIAHHSSSLPDGSYGGCASGFLLALTDGTRIYFAGDTALFLEMRLIAAGGIDLAVLPIGDLFTMGPTESIEAIKLLSPTKVVPCHYNTWPPIEQDAEAWAGRVRQHTGAEPCVLRPGDPLDL